MVIACMPMACAIILSLLNFFCCALSPCAFPATCNIPGGLLLKISVTNLFLYSYYKFCLIIFLLFAVCLQFEKWQSLGITFRGLCCDVTLYITFSSIFLKKYFSNDVPDCQPYEKCGRALSCEWDGGAAVGKFRFATAATLLPYLRWRSELLSMALHCIDIPLGMVSLPYTGFPKSTFFTFF